MSEDQDMVFVNKTGRWFVWDPCGITCAVFTYGLLVYGSVYGVIVKSVCRSNTGVSQLSDLAECYGVCISGLPRHYLTR